MEVASLLYCFIQLGQVPEPGWLYLSESALASGLEAAVNLQRSHREGGSTGGWVLDPKDTPEEEEVNEEKHKYDPDFSKRKKIRDYMLPNLA